MKHATGRRSLAGLFAILLPACAARGAAPPPATGSAEPAGGAAEAREAPLPPATAEERALAERLRSVVQHLSVDVGERHGEKEWNYAQATDDLATVFEKMGFSVRRQGFRSGDDVAQNLEVTVAGKGKASEAVVVGAHYDTARGTPGADDDASGVAAVVELARTFHDRHPARSVRFVLFANGELPHAKTDAMGSLVYAKELVTQGVRVAAMLSLDGLGHYAKDGGSEQYPAGVAARFPAAGNFIAVIGDDRSRDLVNGVTHTLSGHAPVVVIGDVAASGAAYSDDSDHWAFWTVGVPAVMVTDGGPYRSAHHHRATDLPEHLDFDRMARVVEGLGAVLDELAGTASEPGG